MGEIAVIVPVIRRPAAAKRFMDSWRRTTEGRSTVYAVAEISDGPTWQAWATEGATMVLAPGPRYPGKVNAAYRATTEPYLLVLGDDVFFHPGWETAGLAVAAEGWGVVSTNDCRRADLHLLAVHPLFCRAYIDLLGASADGPGTLAHEGYFHLYVDQEWSYLARARGQLAYAEECCIEHLHPAFGKAEDDEIYRLAETEVDRDRELAIARLEEWDGRAVECIRP